VARVFGVPLDVMKLDTWVGVGLVFVVSAALFELARREFSRNWGVAQEEIEKQIQRESAV
jgi:branched-chain amino acid transport system permease protein